MATIDVLAVGPNVSVAARWSYISEHPGALIPYMVILVVLILLGTFGNCLVIATILCIKVYVLGMSTFRHYDIIWNIP